jgi:hypothetical protein
MWEEQRAIVKRCHESTLGQLRDERDRLRAVVDAVLAMWDDLTAVDEDGTHYQFPAAHYAPIDDGLDALGLLDVSPVTGGTAAADVTPD